MFHVYKKTLDILYLNIAGKKIYIKGNENKKNWFENSGSVNSHKSHRRFLIKSYIYYNPNIIAAKLDHPLK